MLGLFKRGRELQTQGGHHRNRSAVASLDWLPESVLDCSYTAVMHRLEAAFDQLEAGRISIDTFEKIVLAERATVQGNEPYQIIERSFDAEAFPSEDHGAALDALERCLDWINSFREAAQESPGEMAIEPVSGEQIQMRSATSARCQSLGVDGEA